MTLTLLFLAFAAVASDDFSEAGVLALVIQRLDADADKVLSEAEYAAFEGNTAFSTMDGDGDGLLTAPELGVWFDRTPPKPYSGSGATLRAAENGLPGVGEAPESEARVWIPMPPTARAAGGSWIAGQGAAPEERPGRSDFSDDPDKIQLHLADLRQLGKGAPFDVTFDGAAPLRIADDGLGLDRVAGDGIYAFLVSRPRSLEVTMTVANEAGSWGGSLGVARATSTRPVPIEMGIDGTLFVVGARMGDRPQTPKGRDQPPGSAVAAPANPKAPEALAVSRPDYRSLLPPIAVACFGAFLLGAVLARWRR